MLADGRLQQRAKLGAVVADALRRWYQETEKEALRGDVVRGCCLNCQLSGLGLQVPCGQLTFADLAGFTLVVLQKAQALLGQMLIEGYGCQADPAKGREWADKARRRGYRMDGVYCKI